MWSFFIVDTDGEVQVPTDTYPSSFTAIRALRKKLIECPEFSKGTIIRIGRSYTVRSVIERLNTYAKNHT